MADGIDIPPCPDARCPVTTLIVRMRASGDPAEVERLLDLVVRQAIPLAYSIAATYANRGVDRDDLNQVAALALLKAVHRFDVARGIPFAGYAGPTIRGELRRYFRDQGSMVRPPRELQELRLAVNAIRPDITQRLGREATCSDLARAVGSTNAKVEAARIAEMAQRPQSLDCTPDGCARAGAGQTGEDPIDRLEWRLTLRQAVSSLPERDRTILRLRFVEDLTQREIAARIGVSQMHVSRLLSGIRSRLGELLEDDLRCG